MLEIWRLASDDGNRARVGLQVYNSRIVKLTDRGGMLKKACVALKYVLFDSYTDLFILTEETFCPNAYLFENIIFKINSFARGRIISVVFTRIGYLGDSDSLGSIAVRVSRIFIPANNTCWNRL